MSKKTPGRKSANAGAAIPSGSPMDVNLLERIVRLMNANDLSTVDVRDGQNRVMLKRAVPVAHWVSTAPPAGSPTAAAPAPPAPVDADAGLMPIKSPMVGTFYAAASPDAKPFVQVGSVVDEDTDVCVIEAMKVFNNIKAECRGTIAKVLVTSGQTVEFGQALFMVKPA